jgi:hypothetical protein
MFSREEAKAIRQEFWTAFGVYMRQHVPLGGPKIKWANYKTGIRRMYFRLDMDAKAALVAIDMEQDDPAIRALFFEQWEELKTLLHGSTGREWTWNPDFIHLHGKEISRISVEKTGLSLFRKDDWGEAFEFLAGMMVALDELWVDAKDVFVDLEN